MHSTGRGAITTTAGSTTARKWRGDGTPRSPVLRNPVGTSHTKQRHQHRTRRSQYQKTSNEKQGIPPENGRNATTTSARHTSNTRWTQGTTRRRTERRRTSRTGTDTTETPNSASEGKESWGHDRRERGAKKHNPIPRPYTGRSGNCWTKGNDP